MSSQNSSSPSPTQQNKNFKRSMSVSEGLHVRLPTLHHTETEPFPYSPVTQQTTNNICPSESNWANKYEDFDIGKPIGYGSSAVVYEAIYKPLKKRVAVKMIDLDMFERNQIDELRRETALMALSKHPNVLRVYGSFVNGSKLYIVTPYLAAGSCLDIMKTTFPDGLDEVSIATILRQALEGLIYLHKNGHIHRDVKAGNLLMDQQGTVLLADFGVSSSLAENGDVRKTFVGTPCWMAPEVMEQAGYDYKADIWSFGITSLELATGHAPFAKFPPMKVLMMTLSNAPPTLDREGGKHKYSRGFKDMIDSCLQKDPNRRPSAEKLIQHPFFKQAKKRDYLVKSILAYVLPLDQRPHKKVPQKHISFESTEQWDFDTQSDDEEKSDSDPAKHAAPPAIPTATTDKSDVPPPSIPLERSKSMVQFEECPRPVHMDKTKSTNASPATETPAEQPPTIKKHISFGDAVIRDPPVRSIMSPVVESPNPVYSPLHNTPLVSIDAAAAATPTVYAPPTLSSAPTSKKSRFVIEDSTPAPHTSTSISPVSDSPISPSNASPSDNHGVGLGISTTQAAAAAAAATSGSANTIPGASSTLTPTAANMAAAAAVAANISSNNNTLQEGEFKKGRFSVNQTPVRSNTPALEEAPTSNSSPGSNPHGVSEKSAPHPPNDLKSISMSRAASQDSFQERKSRFEVKHSNNSGPSMNLAASVASTPTEPSALLQSLPLTRENSNTSALSRDSSINNKISRFSIEKPEAVGPYCELPAAVASAMSPECRKKGRFELTGGSNTPGDALKDKEHLESPQSTVGPSPAISPCSSLQRGQAHRIIDNSMPHMIYAHMESLIKQTEVQKNMLNDLLATMPFMYNQHPPSSGGSILTRTRTVSDTKKPVLSHNEDFYQRVPASSANHASTTVQQQTPQQPGPLSTDINNTIEHLQQLLLLSSKEKERLARENESLKREVERLRRNQQQTPPSSAQQPSQPQQQQSILMKKPSIDSPSSYQQSEKTSLVAPEATNTPANTNQQDKAL
ncbi:Ser/Thr protein kinase [Mucor ambiguus]|uniref:Ser/Thr protein kinase n=1 Tax=Mucor ambiguus TaxID=91626 RepID=A0A0C9M3H6_9FUNG|nr:Ser/Thr protein kinase [Mucor ambiguus]